MKYLKKILKSKRALAVLVTLGLGAVGIALPPEATNALIVIVSALVE